MTNTPKINTFSIEDNNLIFNQICWQKPLKTSTFFCCRYGKAKFREVHISDAGLANFNRTSCTVCLD